LDPASGEGSLNHDRSGIRALLWVGIVVVAVLAGLRLLFHIPKPILVTSVAAFLLCAVASARWGRKRQRATVRVAVLLLAWVALASAFLGATFYVDHGGWIWYRLTGYNVTLPEDLTGGVDTPVGAFLATHPVFSADPHDPTRLVLRRGQHIIGDTIVVPRGTRLAIEPGTVLRFQPGCSLVSYSPVLARGTPDAPIRFTARHPLFKWGVVGVVEADSTRFEYVCFDNGRQARVNGIDMTGSLSLIRSRVEVRSSRFSGLYGKDGVYVRGGEVCIQDNLIENTFKDGLDLDGGSGEVSRNRFINCGDEGLDVSQNDALQVHDNVVLDRRGGRIGAERKLEEILAHNQRGYPETR
jgi:parallel beta helix pectate lyase-like protein